MKFGRVTLRFLKMGGFFILGTARGFTVVYTFYVNKLATVIYIINYLLRNFIYILINLPFIGADSDGINWIMKRPPSRIAASIFIFILLNYFS